MSKLEKYTNYYLNKYKNMEYEHHGNLDLLNNYNFIFDKFIEYEFLDYIYIMYAGSSSNNFFLFSGLIDKYQEYFKRITTEDFPELAAFFNQINRIHHEGDYDKCKLKIKQIENLKKYHLLKKLKSS